MKGKYSNIVVRYGRRNGAKFNESKSLPTSTTNLQFNIFFYINNKIRPTSTISIIINIRNMPTSIKIPLFFDVDDLPHNQHRISTSTTKHVINNLGMNDWLWSGRLEADSGSIKLSWREMKSKVCFKHVRYFNTALANN